MSETDEPVIDALAAPFANREVLVTGGLGFIGSNLARRLVAAGARVTLIDSLIPEYGGNLFNLEGVADRARVNISDVRDPFSMAHLVVGHDYLFNLAGQTSHLDSMREPHADLEINCRAQLSILEACRRHNPSIKVVFASTRQIYGSPEYLPVDEKHPLHPVDVNGINKLAGEWYHRVYYSAYGIRTVVLRLTNTYGPRMRVRDARQTFLGVWIRELLQGRPIAVWGTGEQKRDFSYVDDAVDAFLLAAASDRVDGQVFNVGAEGVISLAELARLLIDTAGGGEYRIVPFPPERKVIDIGDYYADDRLIRTQLGWQPRVSLTAGLARTLAYYRKHGARYWSDS